MINDKLLKFSKRFVDLCFLSQWDENLACGQQPFSHGKPGYVCFVVFKMCGDQMKQFTKLNNGPV